MTTFAAPAATLLGMVGLGFPELTVIAVIAFVGLLAVSLVAFWIWALVDCATHEPDTGNSKLVWILIIALTHIIGAILYLAVRRPERRAQFGR